MASTCTFCSAHSLLSGLKFRFIQRLRWRWRWRRSRSQETEVDNSCTCCWPFGAHAWTTFYARMRHNAEDVTGGRCRGICSCLSLTPSPSLHLARQARLDLCVWRHWLEVEMETELDNANTKLHNISSRATFQLPPASPLCFPGLSVDFFLPLLLESPN